MATVKKESVSELGLVGRIMAMLKAGDEGKINSFLLKVIREREKEIAARKQNIEAEEFEYKSDKIELQEKLEDAEQDYADAFLNIVPENVSNNAAQSRYVDVYLETISRKKSVVKSIEDRIKTLKTNHTDTLEAIELEIKEIEAQVNEIKKG